MKEGREKKGAGGIISAANLPAEFTIKDPRELISEMRRNLLKRLRQSKGLTVDAVANIVGVPVEKVSSLESGKVSHTDMMFLHKLSELYEVDYMQLLYVFKLAKETPVESEYGLAACHDGELDTETQKELRELVEKLRSL